MEARELRTTSSLMTIVVLAGITGFLALVVLKNTLQVRFALNTKYMTPGQAAHAFLGMARGILLPQQGRGPRPLAHTRGQGWQVAASPPRKRAAGYVHVKCRKNSQEP